MNNENTNWKTYKICSIILIILIICFLFFILFFSSNKIGEKGEKGESGQIGEQGDKIIISQNIKIKKINNPINVNLVNFTNILYLLTSFKNDSVFYSITVNSNNNWQIGTQCYFYNSFQSEQNIYLGFGCENNNSSSCSKICNSNSYSNCGNCNIQKFYIKNNQCFELKPKDLLLLTRISINELFLEYYSSNYLLNN
jgi:hypothetical protein